MVIRALATALLLCSVSVPAGLLGPAVAQSEQAVMSTQELMEATALDAIFAQFAPTIADTLESQGLPATADFLAAWKGASEETFDADSMHADLETELEGKFSRTELADLAAFFRSDFGRKITALEREVQMLDTEGQLAADAAGATLLADMPAESLRRGQIDEIMQLVSAEITRSMMAQALRGMMVGMAMSGAQGDIVVPWEEVDRQLETLLPQMNAELEAAQRSLIAYAYRSLSDDDLETYLDFLRTDTAQKFYAVVGFSVGLVMEARMSAFGEELADRLNRVAV